LVDSLEIKLDQGKGFMNKRKSLYQFDHRNEKAIHLYEQIILLSQGKITTSLIKLLVFDDPFGNIYQAVEPGECELYDKFV
jgi:hypothetical protein